MSTNFKVEVPNHLASSYDFKATPEVPLNPERQLLDTWSKPNKDARDYVIIRSLLDSEKIEKTQLLWNGSMNVPVLQALFSDSAMPASALIAALPYREKGQNPVNLAVLANRIDAVSSFLRIDPKDVCRKDSFTEKTPFHAVNRYTSREIVDLLLSHEGQLELRDCFENTPAHLVATEGRLDLLRLYAEKGADFKAVNCGQESILLKWVINRASHFGRDEYLVNLEEGIDFLLSKGIDINHPDNNGYSILDRARSEKLYPEVEAALLARGAISTKPAKSYSSGAVPAKA